MINFFSPDLIRALSEYHNSRGFSALGVESRCSIKVKKLLRELEVSGLLSAKKTGKFLEAIRIIRDSNSLRSVAVNRFTWGELLKKFDSICFSLYPQLDKAFDLVKRDMNKHEVSQLFEFFSGCEHGTHDQWIAFFLKRNVEFPYDGVFSLLGDFTFSPPYGLEHIKIVHMYGC